jgi:hypothetical protein
VSNFFSDYGVTQGAPQTAAQIEAALAKEDIPPPGVYHAVLAEALAPGEHPNPLDAWKLNFLIIAGPENGKKVEHVLWPPKDDDEADPKKKAKFEQNRKLFYHRIGLTAPDATGNLVPAPGKNDPRDCVGVECLINVVHKQRTFQGKNGPATVNEAKLAFEGIVKADDKKAAGVVRAADAVLKAAVAGVKAGAAKASAGASSRYANV